MNNKIEKSFKIEKTFNKEGVKGFSGYLSTFGNFDKEQDRFLKGAFQESLQKKGEYPLYFQHDRREVLGYFKAHEDNNGLFIEANLFEDEKSQNIYKLLKKGALNELSVGFYPLKDGYKTNDFDGYDFKKVDLIEGSVVDYPANSNARIEVVKNLKKEKEMEKEKIDLENKVKRFEKQLNNLNELSESLVKNLTAIEKSLTVVKKNIDKKTEKKEVQDDRLDELRKLGVL